MYLHQSSPFLHWFLWTDTFSVYNISRCCGWCLVNIFSSGRFEGLEACARPPPHFSTVFVGFSGEALGPYGWESLSDFASLFCFTIGAVWEKPEVFSVCGSVWGVKLGLTTEGFPSVKSCSIAPCALFSTYAVGKLSVSIFLSCAGYLRARRFTFFPSLDIKYLLTLMFNKKTLISSFLGYQH